MPGKLSRRAFIIGGIATFAYLYFDVNCVAVKRYTIGVSNLPKDFDGLTILHLTDLHSKFYGDGQSDLLKLISKQDYDIVALTGDIVNKSNPDMEPAVALIEGLKPKPIFFVPGNHERRTFDLIKPILKDLGVRVLENESYKYTKGNSYLWIMGVDDPYLKRDRLDKALKDSPNSGPIPALSRNPKILLAHSPGIFSEAVKNNIDLVLVGHTHGGQVRLPFVGAIVAPGQGVFPEFDYGQFTSDNTKMVINGGLGESVLPIRFYNRPEIVLITLVSV